MNEISRRRWFRSFGAASIACLALCAHSQAQQVEWVPISSSGPFLIGGDTLYISEGGVSIEFEISISGWGAAPYNDGKLFAYNAGIPWSSLLGENAIPPNPGADLVTPAQLACPPTCPTGLCNVYEYGYCDDNQPGYIRKSICHNDFSQECLNNPQCPPGGYCIDNPDFALPGCNASSAVSLNIGSYIEWLAACGGGGVADDGSKHYAGSLRLDVPIGAAGSYTLVFDPDPDVTFMNDGNNLAIGTCSAGVIGACKSDANCDTSPGAGDGICEGPDLFPGHIVIGPLPISCCVLGSCFVVTTQECADADGVEVPDCSIDRVCEDCNDDGEPDILETDPSEQDCDEDGFCNGYEITNCSGGNPGCEDCQPNFIPDECDIADDPDADLGGPGGVGDPDGIPDECQTDTDGDGVSDSNDNCPEVPNGPFLGVCLKALPITIITCTQNSDCDSEPGDGVCQTAQEDADGDGHGDGCDNCRVDSNPGQERCDENWPHPYGDVCAIAMGLSQDCQPNGVPDRCDIDNLTSWDCDEDRVPDECEPDTDGDGLRDDCDNCPNHSNPGQENCDDDNIGDVCALAVGLAQDCNEDLLPDNCDPDWDCNWNGVLDACDIGVAHLREDCQGNGVPDDCDISIIYDGYCLDGVPPCSADCTENGIPDECEPDCDGDGIADSCEIAACEEGDDSCADCDRDGIPDGCQIGGCCLNVDPFPTYEACADDTEANCEAAGGIYRGRCHPCPLQNTALIPEGDGSVFVHFVGVPYDCLEVTGPALRSSCPPDAPKIDPWRSDPNDQMCHFFGVTGSPAIPAGFFCPDSDPGCGSLAWGGPICLQGIPLGDPEYPAADTLIQRTVDPFERCTLPPLPTQAAPIDIEVIALSLVSVDPITVTYGVGDPDTWEVAVDLSTFVTYDTNPALPSGSLTVTKTHCNGGTYTSVLHVQPRFTFTKIGSNPLEVRVLDTGEVARPWVTLEQNDPVPWVVDVDPNLGATGDPCSAFHAGIEDVNQTTSCNCNGNETWDKCDIEGPGSDDCNQNGIPDECETDGDGDGVPDDCDICTGSDDTADSDGDGVPDGCDVCAQGDDNVDADGDGVADACDPCPDDNPNDPDGDSICTSVDNCVLSNPTQADCQPNGVGDVCDIGSGTSTDYNANGIPDDCEAGPLLPATSPYNFRKNRYVAVNPANEDAIAIRVQVAELRCDNSGDACSYDEDCPDSASGERCMTQNGFDPISPEADAEWEAIGWVGAPCRITPGTQVPADTWQAMVVSEMPTLPGIEYVDPGTGTPLSNLFVSDCEVQPRRSYAFSSTTTGVLFSERLVVGTIREPVKNAKKWADVVGQRDAGTGQYTEPNQRINVDDVQVMIVFLNSKSYRPHLTVLDLSHEVPGYKVNADDLQMVMRAFNMTEDYPPLKFQVEASGATHPRDCPFDSVGTMHERCE